jgi:hypothetical protein
MMTTSQTLFRRAEATLKDINRLEHEINRLRGKQQALILSESTVRRQYYITCQEERTLRRNHVPPREVSLNKPYEHLYAQWARWRYLYQQARNNLKLSMGTRYEKRLTTGIARFAYGMMETTCNQAWNPRNPNPHLP